MFHVRVIARLIGQLISMQSAMGPIVRLRSMSLYQCVLSRASWDAPVLVTSKAFDEILFWKCNIHSLNCGKLEEFDGFCENEQTVVYCDASGAGFGGYVENHNNSDVVGCWSESETGLSSTWRELEAVRRVLTSSLEQVKGSVVK